VNAEGLYTYVSSNVEKEWGYKPEEMVNTMYFYDLYPSNFQEAFKNNGLNIIKQKESITGFQNPIMTKDGSIKWVMSAGIPIVDENNEGVGFKGIDTDMTAQKNSEVTLKRNQLFLANLIEHSGTLICAKDRFGKYTLVNQKWEELTGLKREDTLGKTDLELFPVETAKAFMANDREVMEFAKVLEVEEYLETDLGKRTFLSTKFPMYDEKNRVDGICAIISEITARKEAEDHVRYMATHDYLTGLLGLRTLKEQMPLIQGIAQRHDEKVAIMFLDLDGFKEVNDTYGHDAGDDVLKVVAKRIKSGIRDTDIASRIGGDEFVLLISSLHSYDEAEHLSSKLKASIEMPIKTNGHEVSVGVSIGISLYPNDGDDPESLVKIADSRMYDVKKSSR
jgi:diguanylate cyclase (GGDEF)-like protein/PAS domain S-box-containing protein